MKVVLLGKSMSTERDALRRCLLHQRPFYLCHTFWIFSVKQNIRPYYLIDHAKCSKHWGMQSFFQESLQIHEYVGPQT